MTRRLVASREGRSSGEIWASRPAVWRQMERAKRRTRDGHWLFKFEGLGRYGAAGYERGSERGSLGDAAEDPRGARTVRPTQMPRHRGVEAGGDCRIAVRHGSLGTRKELPAGDTGVGPAAESSGKDAGGHVQCDLRHAAA